MAEAQVSEPVPSAPKETEKQERTLPEGTAPVKQEFIDYNHKRVLADKYLPKELAAEIKETLVEKEKDKEDRAEDNGDEPAPKRQKLKGRYKARPFDKKQNDAVKMCHSILKGLECRFGDKCRFIHDVQKYLDAKPADVGDTCYMFTTYGKCPYGLSCRYGSSHIADGKNVVNEKLHAQFVNKPLPCNTLGRGIQIQLRKKKYDFKKANNIVSKVIKSIKTPPNAKDFDFEDDDSDDFVPIPQAELSDKLATNSGAVTDAAPDVDVKDSASADAALTNESTNGASEPPAPSTDATELQDNRVKLETLSVPNDEEGIKLRPLEKKTVDFKDKLYLAPLTTVGNLPFRRVCKQYGVDITCGEMAMSTNLLQGKNSEWALLRRHESEDVFGVQLCGSFPDSMARCGQLIMEQAEVDFIDINCGCPIDLVFKKGGGCALMSRMYKFEQIVRGMTTVLDVPLTIKMRTGIYDDRSNAHKLIPRLKNWGASMVTIHGRSREQRYTRLADWDYINMCAQAGKPIPIYGNGDIMSFEDAETIKTNTDVSGLMLARGALIKPWVFTEIKERRHWDISASERFDMLKDFTNFGLEHWGSDTQGVSNVRRFLLEWLSFLYRYVPVGLLERLPQKINEKPPYYFGRNDLETKMASPNCADWVELSEMLLGPVPDDFTFVPKHKANAYK